MNRFIATTLLSVVASTVLARPASASDDTGYQSYRRVVLGESAVAPAGQATTASLDAGGNPGAYARYLIHLGLSERDAMARAAGVDGAESSAVRRTSEAPIALDSRELYERAVLGHTISELLARRSDGDRRVVQAEDRRQ